MRAFITGVTGFIGSHLAELLLRRGDKVLGATDKGKWRGNAPTALPESVPLLAWDITDTAPPHVAQAVSDFAPTVVFDLAGISIPAQCGTQTPTPHAIDVNVNGVRHVLDLVLSLPTHPRVIFTSTCHVYARVSGEAPVVTENSQISPITPYGETKLRAEHEITQRIQGDGLDACIVRGFHHIGPRQPSGLMLTDWLEQLSDETRTVLHVRCRNSHMDLIDVRDAARAYRLLAEHGRSGEIYNLGSGKAHRSGDVLDSLLASIDRNVQVVESSPAEQWNPIADTRKLRSLGWQPRIRYEQTIADMIPDEILIK